MNLLRKYTLREMVVPFVLTLLLFTFVFLTGTLVKMADTVLNKGVRLWDVFKIIGLIFPEVFSFTLPTSALAATIIGLGGFSQHNELRAMKAVGLNLAVIMIPVLLIAMIVSLLSLAFNDQVVTAASFAKRKLIKQILFKNPTAIFVPNRFIREFDDYIFHVKEVHGNKLEQVIVYNPQENKPTRTIIAETGELQLSEDGSQLTLKLYNGTIDEPGAEELYKLDFETYTMPSISVESAATLEKKMREKSLGEILSYLRRGAPLSDEDRLRHRAEFHKKISFSLATFVFVLIGLPAAVLVRHGELIWSFCISMSVVIIYYVLFVWAGTVASNGFLPPEFVLWLPNVILVCMGGFLMKRAIVS